MGMLGIEKIDNPLTFFNTDISLNTLPKRLKSSQCTHHYHIEGMVSQIFF